MRGDWDHALDALLALSSDRPVPVVLDEFPYLTREAAEFLSVIQRALSPGRRQRAASHTRLLLCGSSMLPVTDLEGTTLRKRGASASSGVSPRL